MQTHSIAHEILRRVHRNVVEGEKMFIEFVEKLCASGLAKEVYLVGSRARGDNTFSSDYDIVAITDEDDVLGVAERIAMLKRVPIPIDIAVLRREDLEDPINSEMLKHKKLLCKCKQERYAHG